MKISTQLETRFLLFADKKPPLQTIYSYIKSVLLPILIVVDILFIAMHLIHRLAYFGALSFEANWRFFIDMDQSYSEIVQYIKLLWVVIALLYIFTQTNKQPVYLVWFALFLYILVDDAFMFHEQAGLFIAESWDISSAFGLRPRDFGELLVLGTVGVTLFIVLPFVYMKSTIQGKIHSQILLLHLALLVTFGIVVDMLHVIVGRYLPVSGMTIVEDGGEMIAMSLLASCMLNIYLQNKPATE